MIVDKGISSDAVEQGFGKIVEIHPGRVAGIFHDDMDVIIAMTGTQAGKVFAEEFPKQLFVVSGLSGQAIAANFQGAVFGDAAAHLA